MNFTNCYEDEKRASAYATLEFRNTYYLAYRDLPQIIQAHVGGQEAIDFGCGTGRSTRFLRRLGFEATGIDIAPENAHIPDGNAPDLEAECRRYEQEIASAGGLSLTFLGLGRNGAGDCSRLDGGAAR